MIDIADISLIFQVGTILLLHVNQGLKNYHFNVKFIFKFDYIYIYIRLFFYLMLNKSFVLNST